MSSKKHLFTLTMAGIALASSENTAEAVAKLENSQNNVKCFGVQKCSGTGFCAVSEAQLNEAKKHFKGRKYDARSVHACKGFNKCAAKAEDPTTPVFLEWVSIPSKEECLKNGGFVFNKMGKIESE